MSLNLMPLSTSALISASLAWPSLTHSILAAPKLLPSVCVQRAA
jgi:hypothetical protein